MALIREQRAAHEGEVRPLRSRLDAHRVAPLHVRHARTKERLQRARAAPRRPHDETLELAGVHRAPWHGAWELRGGAVHAVRLQRHKPNAPLQCAVRRAARRAPPAAAPPAAAARRRAARLRAARLRASAPPWFASTACERADRIGQQPSS